MIEQTIDLKVIPDGHYKIVHVSQDDLSNNRLRFNLFLDGDPFTPSGAMTCKVRGLKPNNSTFEHTMTLDNGALVCGLEEDMTDVFGSVWCNIEITDDEDRTGTQAFIMEVQKGAR